MCAHNGWSVHNCGHDKDASAVCSLGTCVNDGDMIMMMMILNDDGDDDDDDDNNDDDDTMIWWWCL